MNKKTVCGAILAFFVFVGVSNQVIAAEEEQQADVVSSMVISDVTKETPYGKEIYYFVRNKIISPYRKDKFRPNYILNKSQFITLLMALGEVDETVKTNTFVDVPVDHWAHKFVEAAVKQGLIDVPVNRKFYPRALQREDEAYRIVNGYLKIDTTAYPDAETNPPYSSKNFLTRSKVVEYMANTEKFKSKIEEFKTSFAIPAKAEENQAKDKFLDDAINKYLTAGGGGVDSGDLIADIKDAQVEDNESIILKKLSKALTHIHNWEYHEAISLTDEVLESEPDNVVALMRRGSAYYLLDDVDKARSDWYKVLELDPGNEVVKQFLAKEGRKEGQLVVSKRVELEGILENRLEQIIKKAILVQDVVVLVGLQIGAEMVAPMKENALLPGIPAQSSNLYEKYFIKNIDVKITVDENVDPAKIAKLPSVVKNFVDLPIEENKNLFITKADLSDKSYVGMAEKLYVSNQLLENNRSLTDSIDKRVIQSQQVISSELRKSYDNNQKLVSDASLQTLKQVQGFVNEVKTNYAEVMENVGEIKEDLRIEKEKQRGFNLNHIVSIANTAAVALVLLLLFLTLRSFASKVDSSLKSLSGGEGEGGGSSAAGGGGGEIGGDISVGAISGGIEGDDDDSTKEMSVRKSSAVVGFFDYIDDGNIFKLKHLLKTDYDAGLITIEQVAIISSYLPPSMTNMILREFAPDERAEIISYLVYSNQYTPEDIKPLDNQIKDKISCLVGGKDIVLGVFNDLRDEQKTTLTKTLADKFPDVLEEIRDMIVLFEDILLLDEDSLKKLFSVIDPYIVAASILNIDDEDHQRILSVLTEGMRDMVSQVVELKKDTMAAIEILDAQEHVVKVAKALAKKGTITLIKKTFGSWEEDKQSQSSIDDLIAQAMGGASGDVMVDDNVNPEEAIETIDKSEDTEEG